MKGGTNIVGGVLAVPGGGGGGGEEDIYSIETSDTEEGSGPEVIDLHGTLTIRSVRFVNMFSHFTELKLNYVYVYILCFYSNIGIIVSKYIPVVSKLEKYRMPNRSRKRRRIRLGSLR